MLDRLRDFFDGWRLVRLQRDMIKSLSEQLRLADEIAMSLRRSIELWQISHDLMEEQANCHKLKYHREKDWALKWIGSVVTLIETLGLGDDMLDMVNPLCWPSLVTTYVHRLQDQNGESENE